MTKAALETNLRNSVIATISDFLKEHYVTDVLTVGAGEVAIPLLDEEDNEKFAVIKISIPRGTRNGNGGYDAYDGYTAADDYKAELAEKEAKRAASAEKKAMAEKLREQKRALRAAKKVAEEIAG